MAAFMLVPDYAITRDAAQLAGIETLKTRFPASSLPAMS